MGEENTLFFAPEDYPKREFLEPLLINSGLIPEDYIPENYNGHSKARFLPELLVNLILLGNTNILSNYEIKVDKSFSGAKTIFKFYTTWAGLDEKNTSLTFRCLNMIGTNVKYFSEDGSIITLSIEERYYYAILVRTILQAQNGVYGNLGTPTYALYNKVWMENINPQTVIPIEVLSNCITINNFVYDTNEFMSLPAEYVDLTSREYEDLIYLACLYDANYILLHWENNVHPTKFRAILDMGVPVDEVIEYAKALPDEWYNVLKTK